MRRTIAAGVVSPVIVVTKSHKPTSTTSLGNHSTIPRRLHSNFLWAPSCLKRGLKHGATVLSCKWFIRVFKWDQCRRDTQTAILQDQMKHKIEAIHQILSNYQYGIWAIFSGIYGTISYYNPCLPGGIPRWYIIWTINLLRLVGSSRMV